MGDHRCKKCDRPFDDKNHIPRSLSKCGHTFCEKCANDLWKKGEQKQIQCPICKAYTPVKHFIDVRKNYFAIELLESLRPEGTAPVQTPTEGCSMNPLHEAWYHCAKCEVDFCENCIKSSHAGKWDHQKELKNLGKLIPPKCRRHPQRPAEFICDGQDCQFEGPICSQCLAENHNGHKVSFFDRIANRMTKLRETLLEEPIPTKTDVPRSVLVETRNSYMLVSEGVRNLVRQTNQYFGNPEDTHVPQIFEFANVKFKQASDVLAAYDKIKTCESNLEKAERNIRRRISKRLLHDAFELCDEHKRCYQALKNKRKLQPILPLSAYRLRLPTIELELLDADV